MNTVSNPQAPASQQPSLAHRIISALDSQAMHMSIASMLQELQIIIERLTFGSESIEGELSKADIEVLVGTDVSKEMLDFVDWLFSRRLINLLVGTTGRKFLSFCDRYYKAVVEVRCTVPINLTEQFQQHLIEELRQVYPSPARIIFDVSPSIVAGCIINDGKRQVDLSLARQMPRLIDDYIGRMRPAKIGVAHGR